MNRIYKYFWCIICIAQAALGAIAPVAKSVGKSVAGNSSVVTGVIFQGMTEQGVSQNTFLCGDSSVTSSAITGANVESGDCSMSKIQDAIGFDVSGGKTVQFFNNFMYWTRQKSQIEQDYQTNNPGASDSDVASYVQKKGLSFVGAFCIIISTNEILQEIIGQDKQAASGEVKVIVQLWYNGDNLIQLWSQDVAIMQPGQSFTVAISNAVDTNLSTVLQDSTNGQGYLSAVIKTMQPNNRNADSYNAAASSPRMVKIQVS